MRYFHRSSLPPDEVLAEADRFFGGSLSPVESGARARVFSGALGKLTVTVAMEGGHYTRIMLETDQVGESEADKLARRFLAVVHTRAEPQHQLRGAY
jgi:hypothetical protein